MEVKSCSITKVMNGMAAKSMVDRGASLLLFVVFFVGFCWFLFWGFFLMCLWFCVWEFFLRVCFFVYFVVGFLLFVWVFCLVGWFVSLMSLKIDFTSTYLHVNF